MTAEIPNGGEEPIIQRPSEPGKASEGQKQDQPKLPDILSEQQPFGSGVSDAEPKNKSRHAPTVAFPKSSGQKADSKDAEGFTLTKLPPAVFNCAIPPVEHPPENEEND